MLRAHFGTATLPASQLSVVVLTYLGNWLDFHPVTTVKAFQHNPHIYFLHLRGREFVRRTPWLSY